NLPRLLESSHVVVDALDRLPTRLMLQETARKLGIPLVHGAIGGMIGPCNIFLTNLTVEISCLRRFASAFSHWGQNLKRTKTKVIPGTL
ncbi:MAG: hypothetical protein E3J81_06575, partial [Dehalococcoidia bacterium]